MLPCTAAVTPVAGEATRLIEAPVTVTSPILAELAAAVSESVGTPFLTASVPENVAGDEVMPGMVRALEDSVDRPVVQVGQRADEADGRGLARQAHRDVAAHRDAVDADRGGQRLDLHVLEHRLLGRDLVAGHGRDRGGRSVALLGGHLLALGEHRPSSSTLAPESVQSEPVTRGLLGSGDDLVLDEHGVVVEHRRVGAPRAGRRRSSSSTLL